MLGCSFAKVHIYQTLNKRKWKNFFPFFFIILIFFCPLFPSSNFHCAIFFFIPHSTTLFYSFATLSLLNAMVACVYWKQESSGQKVQLHVKTTWAFFCIHFCNFLHNSFPCSKTEVITEKEKILAILRAPSS